MASGYIKNRKLAKFKSSRHSPNQNAVGNDKREAAKKDRNAKKEGKRELAYDKGE